MNNYSNENGVIILMGGQSKRMGTPKATLKMGPKTILECLLDTFASTHPATIVVVKSEEQDAKPYAGVTWATDTVPDEGPLRGLAAGIGQLPRGIEKFFLSGCDSPLLKSELVSFLMDYPKDAEAIIPYVRENPQPLFGVYKTHMFPKVQQMLQEGQRSLRALIKAIDTHFVTEEEIKQVDPGLVSFENVNTPSDYQRVLEIFNGLP